MVIQRLILHKSERFALGHGQAMTTQKVYIMV